MAASQDPAFAPLPVIGNGDVLSWRDHEERLEQARESQLRQAEARESLEAGESQRQPQQRWSTCCMLARSVCRSVGRSSLDPLSPTLFSSDFTFTKSHDIIVSVR